MAGAEEAAGISGGNDKSFERGHSSGLSFYDKHTRTELSNTRYPGTVKATVRNYHTGYCIYPVYHARCKNESNLMAIWQPGSRQPLCIIRK